MSQPTSPQGLPASPDPETLAEGLRAGDRSSLARAITLVESRRPDHQRQAESLIARILPHSGGSHRIAVTGVPGVGKSSVIERLGLDLVAQGKRVAVLSVDPSSQRSGGSILGDKTRMAGLAAEPSAFIRPSPTGGNLGGVGRATRTSILLCEAAGYDIVLLETVGVGQSETLAASMVDSFLLLVLPGGGDALQGIKRGILELADILAVNQADGQALERAGRTRSEYARAMHLMAARPGGWQARVLTCSALTGDGIEGVWEALVAHRDHLVETEQLEPLRRAQQVDWMNALIQEGLAQALRSHPEARALHEALAEAVAAGSVVPTEAARRVLTAFGLQPDED